ncbi:MAG: M20/M25/M40 family metallo-hydrolase [Candidatus Lokiarchaeota archaeon]
MIKEKRISKNLNQFSFPRLSGSEKEKELFKKLKNKIEELNLDYNIQNFTFTKFYPKIYQKITFTLVIWFLLVLYFIPTLFSISINLIIILLIFIPLVVLTRNPSKIRIGKKYSSNNIFLNFSNNSEKNLIENMKNEKNLFLIAHIDSKGQTLPMLLRVVNIRIWIYSLITSSILIIIKNVFFYQILFFNVIALVSLLINLITTIIVLLNFSTNNSPGAIDDASGVTILIELLNHLSEEQIKINDYNLWFLFTGSEENGTMGIRNFFNHIKDFNKLKTKFINFDSVAQRIDTWGPANNLERDKGFYRTFMKLTKEESNLYFHFKPFIFATIRSDAYYLKTEGFKGFSFGDTTVYKHIHSKRDTADKINPKILSKLCKIIVNFLRELDN